MLPKRSRQRTIAIKKANFAGNHLSVNRNPGRAGQSVVKPANSNAHHSGATSKGRFAGLLVVGVLVAAAIAFGVSRKSNTWPARTIAANASNSVASSPTTLAANLPQAAHDHASAGQLMMGGDPSKEFNPGPSAAKSATVTSTPANTNPAALSAFEGLITLDPVCETIELPSRPFPPGNPAPSTRRMAQRLAEIRDKMNPNSAGYLNDRMAEMQICHLSIQVAVGRFGQEFYYWLRRGL